VWSFPKYINWINNFKQKYNLDMKALQQHQQQLQQQQGGMRPLHTRSLSLDSSEIQQHKITNLTAPYIKYEPVNEYLKPVVCEFRNFPSLFLEGVPGTSPFYSLESSKNRFQRQKQMNENLEKKAAKRLREEQGGTNKKLKQSAKESAIPVAPPKPGYCELCQANFPDLDEHVETEIHQKVSWSNQTWEAVDKCLGLVNSGL